MNAPLAVVRVGTCCPVGLDTVETVASLRAGVSRLTETIYEDEALDPIIVGHLDDELLPPLVSASWTAGLNPLQRRLLRLATWPLQEVLEGYGSSPSPLFLAAPEVAPGRAPLVGAHVFHQLAAQAERPLDVGASRLFAAGRAGLFAALAAAHAELGRREFVLVGGLDSYLASSRLVELAGERRLRTAGPQDAFTPGEAAAFVLLTTHATCRRLGLRPLAWIVGVGLGFEPGHRYSEQPLLGDGLSAAFAETFANFGDALEPISLELAGLNGERMFAKESGVAHVRHRERFAEALTLEHPASSIGDAGAALAPLMLTTAAWRMASGSAPSPALLWAASDRGQRGAAILRAV